MVLRCSTSNEVRRRRFLGLPGLQSPQPSAGRGTPPEEPQPNIVTRVLMPAVRPLAVRPRALRPDGHFVKEPEEVFCRLVGYALVGDASHLRQDLGCFHHIGWFVSLATVWSGREIWRIGFDEKPVIRKRRRDRANGFAGLECKHAG